jgi:hypothetical protein
MGSGYRRIVTVTSKPLHNAKQLIDAVYLTALARELVTLGFRVDRCTGKGARYFEVAGSRAVTARLEQPDPRDRGEATRTDRGVRERYGREPNVVELRDLSIRHRLAKGRIYPDPRTFWRDVGEHCGVRGVVKEAARSRNRWCFSWSPAADAVLLYPRESPTPQ